MMPADSSPEAGTVMAQVNKTVETIFQSTWLLLLLKLTKIIDPTLQNVVETGKCN